MAGRVRGGVTGRQRGENLTDYQATIRLTVLGPTGQAQEIDAVIDTGFDGTLTLPSADIIALGLPWRRRGRALLAMALKAYLTSMRRLSYGMVSHAVWL